MTRSPSMRPGHPRSSASSRGVNMHSFTPQEPSYEGLRGRGDVAVVARGGAGPAVDPDALGQRRVLGSVDEAELRDRLVRRRAEERRLERRASARVRAGRMRVQRATGDGGRDETYD